MFKRKAFLRWLKATLILGGLPLTTAAMGSYTRLPGIWITLGEDPLFLFDSDDFKSESPNAKKSDQEKFTTGVNAVLAGEERPEQAFEKLQEELGNSICITNNLAIAYMLSRNYDEAEETLAALKELRWKIFGDQSYSSEMREILEKNCDTLEYLLSI